MNKVHSGNYISSGHNNGWNNANPVEKKLPDLPPGVRSTNNVSSAHTNGWNNAKPSEKELPPLPVGVRKMPTHSKAQEKSLRQKLFGVKPKQQTESNPNAEAKETSIRQRLFGGMPKLQSQLLPNAKANGKSIRQKLFGIKPKQTQQPTPKPILTPQQQMDKFMSETYSLSDRYENEHGDGIGRWRTNYISNKDIVEYMQANRGCTDDDIRRHLSEEGKFSCEHKYANRSEWDPGFPSAKDKVIDEVTAHISKKMGTYERLREKVAQAEQEALPHQKQSVQEQHNPNGQQQLQSEHYSSSYQQPQTWPHVGSNNDYWNGQQQQQPQSEHYSYSYQQRQTWPHVGSNNDYWNGQQQQPQSLYSSYTYPLQHTTMQPYVDPNHAYWNDRQQQLQYSAYPNSQQQTYTQSYVDPNQAPQYAQYYSDAPHQLNAQQQTQQFSQYQQYQAPQPQFNSSALPRGNVSPPPSQGSGNSYPTLNGNNLRQWSSRRENTSAPPPLPKMW